MKQQNSIFVFHGTDLNSAENIIRKGVVIQNSPGYFGSAFYVTDDPLLAQSNYAGLTNGNGAVLQFEMKIKGLLDLRIEEDIEKWSNFINKNDLFDQTLTDILTGMNADGSYPTSGRRKTLPPSVQTEGVQNRKRDALHNAVVRCGDSQGHPFAS